LQKPVSERHPLLVWYETGTRYMNRLMSQPRKVHIAPMTGALAAYMGLAYNLYLSAHNVKLQELLIGRLKSKESFYGAYYETYVIGALVRAGFNIELEDETDVKTSHCELTATFRETGKKFSVEAKIRGANKTSADVGNQLYDALRKRANHPRVVFIEVNVPVETNQEGVLGTLKEVLRSIRTREEKLTIDGQPAPPAYVIVTNNPHSYDLNGEVMTWSAAEGFKIPDFRVDSGFLSLRDALNARERHIEMFSLMKSLAKHREIPSTFDGDSPDLAFIDGLARLIVGHRYAIPDDKGGETVGELEGAVVMESKKSAFGFYKLPDGKRVLVECPLTDEEMAAYHRHPETFFGVVSPNKEKAKDLLDLYDFIFNGYKDTPKERLLELMKGAPDHNRLAALSQKELASVFAERTVYSFVHMTGFKGHGSQLSGLS